MSVKIKVEALPLHFLVLGGFLILYSVFNFITAQGVILNLVLLLLAIILLTSQQRLEINTANNSYSEFYWVLGMKLSNNVVSYSEIISVECTAANYSQEYGKYNRRFISGIMFKGYIELKEQEKLYIGQNKNKTAMLKKLTKIGSQLQVPLEDNTNIES